VLKLQRIFGDLQACNDLEQYGDGLGLVIDLTLMISVENIKNSYLEFLQICSSVCQRNCNIQLLIIAVLNRRLIDGFSGARLFEFCPRVEQFLWVIAWK
jgi:hypothetical protein